MRASTTRVFFAVTGVLLCLVLAQPAASEELQVSGKVEETFREDSIIIVDPSEESEDIIVIKGFPFNYAERELEIALGAEMDTIAIESGDCVTISYIVKEMGIHKKAINKASALTYYCGDCSCSDCKEEDKCYVDTDSGGIVFLLPSGDDTYLPVNKKPLKAGQRNN